MVGGEGLELQVLKGIARANESGEAFEAGLAIVILAIVLDLPVVASFTLPHSQPESGSTSTR